MSMQPARSRATEFPKMARSAYGVPLINKQSVPVEWAALMYELEDAQEHLTALISEMSAADDFDEVDLRIQLGHVFSHLNRAWHRRDKVYGPNQEEWQDASRFPSDLDPT